MKRIFILGAFTLISTTLLSCTVDEYTTDSKATLENEIIPAENNILSNADQDPGDQPIVVPIPKK